MSENSQAFASSRTPISTPPAVEYCSTMLDFVTSASTAKLDSALAKAQGEIAHASKDAVNPHFGKTYANLASVWDACRKALSSNGISVTQWPIPAPAKHIGLITRLAHEGEWMKAGFILPNEKSNAQGAGGAITYLRRYALAAVVGVAPDDDDDGNGAAGRAPQDQGFQGPGGHSWDPPEEDLDMRPPGAPGPSPFPSKPSSGPKPASGPATPPKPPSKAQLARLFAVADTKGWMKDQIKLYLEARFKIATTSDLTLDQYKFFVNVIETVPPAEAIRKASIESITGLPLDQRGGVQN